MALKFHPCFPEFKWEVTQKDKRKISLFPAAESNDLYLGCTQNFRFCSGSRHCSARRGQCRICLCSPAGSVCTAVPLRQRHCGVTSLSGRVLGATSSPSFDDCPCAFFISPKQWLTAAVSYLKSWESHLFPKLIRPGRFITQIQEKG